MTANFDLLSPNRIKIIVHKFPDIQISAQKVNIPGITINPAEMPTNSNKDTHWPGDKLQYDDLVIQFLLDEQLNSYKAVKNWMNQITLEDEQKSEFFSDMTVEALTNNHNLNQTLRYYNCFPYMITGIELDTTIDESVPIVVSCFFKFNKFEIIGN